MGGAYKRRRLWPQAQYIVERQALLSDMYLCPE